jgi:hypothetical protein
MKRLNLVLLLLLLVICGNMYSIDIPPVTSPPPRVQSFSLPVSINVIENTLAIHFNKTMGETEIAIMNEMGEIVYSASTDTDISPDFFIPTDGLNSGIYTISFQYGDNILTQSFVL